MLHDETVGLVEDKIITSSWDSPAASEGHPRSVAAHVRGEIEYFAAVHSRHRVSRITRKAISKSSTFDDEILIAAAIGVQTKKPFF